MQLTINGYPIALAEGETLKLTRENPFFTDAGDYTLDVSLSLRYRENAEAFGIDGRLENQLSVFKSRKYVFNLIAPPIVVSGEAKVTKVKQHEISVQLIGGRSALNNAFGDNDVYIDELELGKAYDNYQYKNEWGALEDVVDFDNEQHLPSCLSVKQFLFALSRKTSETALRKMNEFMFGNQQSTHCVLFPLYAENSDETVNFWTVGNSQDTQLSDKVIRMAYGKDAAGNIYHTEKIAPMPYLMEIVKRIVESSGLKFDKRSQEMPDWWREIFIVNSRQTMNYAAMLPHWTFRDFVKNIQDFLGAVFIVEGSSVRLVPRSKWYERAEEVTIENVLDEFEAEIDNDAATKDSSAGNVDYDWPDRDPMLQVPEEVWENAAIYKATTSRDLNNFANNMLASERRRSRYLFTFITGMQHIVKAWLQGADGTYYLTTIDVMPPLIRREETREIQTKLKFVPALMYRTMQSFIEINGKNVNSGVAPWTMLKSMDTTAAGTEDYSVDLAINPQEDSGEEGNNVISKRDVIEVAHYGSGYLKSSIAAFADVEVPAPSTTGYVRSNTTGLLTTASDIKNVSKIFDLNGNYIGKGLTDGLKVETKVQKIIQFADNRKLDMRNIFIIHGRKYVAEKIVYEFKSSGSSPIKTGYFYEL